MTEDEAQTLIGGLLPGDSTLTDDDRTPDDARGGRQPVRARAAGALRRRHRPERRASRRRSPAMFDARLDALSPDARRFLETLAICGRPMAPEIVCDACGIARDRQSLVVMLRASRLIRSSGSSARVETYHDRIREVLAERLEPDAVRDDPRPHGGVAGRATERRLRGAVRTLSRRRRSPSSASMQAGLAAEKASAALAFDRAASFYQSRAGSVAVLGRRVTRGEKGSPTALANAGRPAEAAEAYLRAAEGADTRAAGGAAATGGGAVPHRRAHRSRARSDSARARERRAESCAAARARAAVRLVWRRARLGWRGLEFVPRRSRRRRRRCAPSPGHLLGGGDRAGAGGRRSAPSDFIAQHLHLALDAGEPSRIARGLALESAAQKRGLAIPERQRAGWLSVQRAWPAVSARRRRSRCRLLADSVTATAIGEWKRALTLVRAGAGDPARPVRRRDLGDEHRAEHA